MRLEKSNLSHGNHGYKNTNEISGLSVCQVHLKSVKHTRHVAEGGGGG